MILFCFADGETEAQRGRSVGSRDRAGGKGRQSPGWTPAQGLDTASTAVLPVVGRGAVPHLPTANEARHSPRGCEGRRGLASCGGGWPEAEPTCPSLLALDLEGCREQEAGIGGLGGERLQDHPPSPDLRYLSDAGRHLVVTSGLAHPTSSSSH